MEIGLLVSGRLGFAVFEQLLDFCKINFVLTDGNSSDVISFCKEKGIDCFSGNPRKGRALASFPNLTCDVLVSVNYLFLVDRDVIDRARKMAINFHGSLLPKYRGRTPHVWAIINNENETGITAHKIIEETDAGDIIAQKRIPIESFDTGGSILKKFEEEYPGFVMEVLQSISSNTFQTVKQESSLATYFGKRTAEDGRINWDWQKERIRNWVRAQAKPYPGSFTFSAKEKIVVHQILFSEFGFNCEVPNGTILGFEKKLPLIKTPNGVIKLIEFECDCNLETGDILK